LRQEGEGGSTNLSRVGYTPIEQTPVRDIADYVWRLVLRWDTFAKNTVGRQLVEAADSVCANLAEGDGRATDADAGRFFVYARGPAREARLWVDTARRRELITKEDADSLLIEMESAGKALNGLIKYRRAAVGELRSREERSPYAVDDLDLPSTLDAQR
jgi:four helix bundle protein